MSEELIAYRAAALNALLQIEFKGEDHSFLDGKYVPVDRLEKIGILADAAALATLNAVNKRLAGND